MSFRKSVIFPLLCLITISLVLPFTVYAHETILQTTSISNLSYPAEAALDASSSVIVPVSFTATLSNTPINSAYVFISIINEDTTTYVEGSVISSSPYTCKLFPQYSQSTVCNFVPLTSSGSENVEFGMHLTSARIYHFKLIVAFVEMNIYPPQPVPSTISVQLFDVTITPYNGATTNAYTSATYPWLTYTSSYTPNFQMPQPPAIQSTNNTPQLLLAIAVIAAVVLAAVFLYSRRKGQTVKTAEKVDTAVAPSSTMTAEGKRVCIECGNELPPNLKFCDNCGTKQP